MRVIPAILPKNIEELERGLVKLREHSALVQIDICDGKFVPSVTWPYSKDKESEKGQIAIDQNKLSLWKSFDFEFDLFTFNPEIILEEAVHNGIRRAVIHQTSTFNLENIIIKYSPYIDITIGISLDANLEEIKNFMGHVSTIQCMGIRKPGFPGQPFDKKVIDQVKEIREKYPHHIISVDGEVN